MDFCKSEPFWADSNSISTKLWVWFLPKHTFHGVSLVTPKTMNHEGTQRNLDFAKYTRYFRSSNTFGSLSVYFRFR